MNDTIYSINGPVVTLRGARGFSMMEMVYVGEVGLIGEVIGITSEKTTIQVYEDTAGLKVGDIVKTTVFVKDLNDFATVNATYEAFFTEHNATFPARSCVEVARLPKDVKIEIEAIAVRR